MRTRTKLYVAFVFLLGLAASLWSAWSYFLHHSRGWDLDHFITFGILTLLCILCCSMPLYTRKDCTIDMSFISIIAIVLLEGPAAAVIIYFISTPFVVVATLDGKGVSHIFNTDPVKTLFNTGNLSISLFLGGVAYYYTGGVPGSIIFPGVLLPIILFLLTAVLTNSLLMMLLFRFQYDMKFYPTVVKMFFQLLPSILCSAPIGIFLAVLLLMPSGRYMAPLFLLPLMLARFSFKLFLRSQQQQYEIVRTLTAAIEAKDKYTMGHSQRVGNYAARIAFKMGLSEKRIRRLKTAAVFHDIGKLGISDAILQKPSFLTHDEQMEIWKHPQIGVRILCNIDTYDDLTELVLHHHERYDGGGYPSGTRGKDLQIDTYILSAADTYDAITSDRPYRKGMTPQRAKEIILEEKGKQFHPDVAVAVAAMIDSGEIDVPVSEEEDMDAE